MFPHHFFKLLSDETRLRCLCIIAREGRLCVGEIAVALDLSQPKISRHLALLRANGVLNDVRQGQWVFYQVSSDLPQWMHQQIDFLMHSDAFQAHFENDIQRLAEMESRQQCCS